MNARILAGLTVVLLMMALVGGCVAPQFTIKLEADEGVTWEGYWKIKYSFAGGRWAPASPIPMSSISGSGDWQYIVPAKDETVVGVLIKVTKTCEEGLLRISIVRGEEVVAEDESSDPYGGTECLWGDSDF